MAKETLPTGFTRRASGALRVQIRLKGHEPALKSFPLIGKGVTERKRQLADAEAWATETRRRLMAGGHVSSREAERTSLAEGLRRYETEGMAGKDANQQIDRYRIQMILRDPIAERPVAFLSDKDIAAFRDRLLRAGWRKKVSTVLRRLSKLDVPKRRIDEVKSLLRQREEADATQSPDKRREIEAGMAAIELREGIKAPARTTIVNVVQIIGRALNHLRQTMDGVPRLEGVKMPKASPGRERRVSEVEMTALTQNAASFDPALPLLIDFAVNTTLRRGRVLSVCLSDIRDVGSGVRAIVFPKNADVRNKRTGIVPITTPLRKIIEEACALRGLDPRSNKNFKLFDISKAQLTLWWEKLLTLCDISDLHWHDLRHEGTSRLFEKGLSTAEVMSITGHSTQDMVDRYSHYSAAIVHRKLEHGIDVTALHSQIEFLLKQFVAAGGKTASLSLPNQC